ncbi:MAG: hypothetical protein H6618_05345 [Deltaproteobacteria bacterium]|nr:hypothetical protein [Deltaproteobacteria bacterium]
MQRLLMLILITFSSNLTFAMENKSSGQKGRPESIKLPVLVQTLPAPVLCRQTPETFRLPFCKITKEGRREAVRNFEAQQDARLRNQRKGRELLRQRRLEQAGYAAIAVSLVLVYKLIP